mmetsp:Transcript_36698/g.85727  ORF Transcript_36698/g.85727 Transcript_36698/m.85727 type:complete len:291 (-) Transcript_36698:287-1159(-)
MSPNACPVLLGAFEPVELRMLRTRLSLPSGAPIKLPHAAMGMVTESRAATLSGLYAFDISAPRTTADWRAVWNTGIACAGGGVLSLNSCTSSKSTIRQPTATDDTSTIIRAFWNVDHPPAVSSAVKAAAGLAEACMVLAALRLAASAEAISVAASVMVGVAALRMASATAVATSVGSAAAVAARAAAASRMAVMAEAVALALPSVEAATGLAETRMAEATLRMAAAAAEAISVAASVMAGATILCMALVAGTANSAAVANAAGDACLTVSVTPALATKLEPRRAPESKNR